MIDVYLKCVMPVNSYEVLLYPQASVHMQGYGQQSNLYPLLWGSVQKMLFEVHFNASV